MNSNEAVFNNVSSIDAFTFHVCVLSAIDNEQKHAHTIENALFVGSSLCEM